MATVLQIRIGFLVGLLFIVLVAAAIVLGIEYNIGSARHWGRATSRRCRHFA